MKSNFIDLGGLQYKLNIDTFSIPVNVIPQDVSIYDTIIIFREDDQFRIYDRKCDHKSGKLCLIEGILKCPMHDWTFDPKIGQYTNIQTSKKELDYEIINENLVVRFNNEEPKLPCSEKNRRVKITYLSHACLLVETESVSFVTDPWIIGFAFCGGWWPKSPPPKDWENIINSVDFIYISHNHPDHLNPFTLESVRKDMEFIVPDFPSRSVTKMLIKNGFKNIFEANLQNYFRYKDTELFLTIFKSGDFRDDSGLYFTYGNFSFLSTVDSNNLNFDRYPKDITLFASAFASGASGFPLCFETVEINNKNKILEKNRKIVKLMVKKNIEKCGASFFIPYAGFFLESAKRDLKIFNQNKKNKITDFHDGINNTKLLNIDVFDSYSFIGSALYDCEKIQRDYSNLKSPESIISETFNKYSYSEAYIKSYFNDSLFQKELVLYLSLTNDDFSKTKNSLVVDFRLSRVKVDFLNFDWRLVKNGLGETNEYNVLHIKVRQDSFLWVVNNKNPWEDLLIGFQCRIDRVPDVYNVDFWHHFTNVYI
jgi:CMP-N-acetylneuraminate monooxygenase